MLKLLKRNGVVILGLMLIWGGLEFTVAYPWFLDIFGLLGVSFGINLIQWSGRAEQQ